MGWAASAARTRLQDVEGVLAARPERLGMVSTVFELMEAELGEALRIILLALENLVEV